MFLSFFNDTATTEIYTLSLHDALPISINPDTNKIPKHLFKGYLNIYNNYFKAPWMPDRTEANPNELNQDDARYGFRCCHLKNIWTAPLPPETELSRQMTTSTTSIDRKSGSAGMPRPISYAVFCLKKKTKQLSINRR